MSLSPVPPICYPFQLVGWVRKEAACPWGFRPRNFEYLSGTCSSTELTSSPGCVSLLQSHLYLLVTDQGFLQEEQVVWESLHNVDGDSCFCDSDFHLSHSLGKSHGAEGGSGSPEKQLQVDQVCEAFWNGTETIGF